MKSQQSHANSGTTRKTTTILLTLLGAASMTQAAVTVSANLLTDSGFENNPLGIFTTVLGDFAGHEGEWGSEVGTIASGPSVDFVTPFGKRMLSMEADGGITSQTVQLTDLTSFGPGIATGTATFNLSGMFTTGTTSPLVGGVSGASAGVVVSFYTVDGTSSPTTPSSFWTSLALDSDYTTWESISVTGTIPSDALWMSSQVLYTSASLGANPGYVDETSLTITTIPESSSYALLGLGVSALLINRRRQART